MTTATIRIPKAAHERAMRLAKEDATSLSHVIDEALALYEREHMLAKYNEDMARLRADPAASREYDDDVAAWDATLLDGLDGHHNE